MGSKALLGAACALGCALLGGCGSGVPVVQQCSAGDLTTATSGSPNFSLSLVNPELTIYPGQTEQVAVMISPVGNSSGTVTVGGVSDIQGLTVTGTTAAIGTIATLTVTAANNVASSCFVGVSNVFTADRPLKLTGMSTTGSLSTGVDLEVVLENPAFKPASVNLPVLTINTAGAVPIVSKDDYVDGTMTIVDAANPSYNYSGTLEVKGHGNSTWAMPKKPYRLNLDSKAALLGMTSDANWILLANYDDKTMLRNDVAFQMSELIGMAWTPHSASVEVMLNGEYEGTYQLTEKVEVSKARLDIGSIDATDNSGTDLTGGYLGEVDHYSGETLNFNDAQGLPIGLADPDPPTAEQAAYFMSNFNTAEATLYSPTFTDVATGWQSAWDLSSSVNYFLVEELAGNQDANDWSSEYFYKPRSDPRFYRGPVWDMDVSFGNDDYGPIQSPNVPWVSTNSRWYEQLLQDPAFVAAVKTEWAATRSQMVGLLSYIDTRAAALSQAATNNYSRWPTLGERVWPNPTVAGTYSGEVTMMKNWLTARIAYMDANYGK